MSRPPPSPPPPTPSFYRPAPWNAAWRRRVGKTLRNVAFGLAIALAYLALNALTQALGG